MSALRARPRSSSAQRRSAILSAARTLFSAWPFTHISLNAIAREMGFPKTHIYAHFSSCEEMFLEIFIDEFETLSRALHRRLKPRAQPLLPEEVSEILTQTAVRHETYLRLLPQLATALEANNSVDQVVAFKLRLLAALSTITAALHAAAPWLAPDQWRQALIATIALFAGLWPIANPSDRVETALRRTRQKTPPVDFVQICQPTLTALFRGLAAPPPTA